MKTHRILLACLALGILSPTAYAEAPAAPPTYSVASLLTAEEIPVGKEITLTGFPTSVCKRNGKKAWLRDANPDAKGLVRVERGSTMAPFQQDLIGVTLQVTGILRETRMDAAYFDAWEARVKAAQSPTVADSATSEKEGCSGDCNRKIQTETVLKNIAGYREQLAKSPKGYLSSLWLEGTKWQRAAVAATP
jgi:hypothetical protein